MAPDTAIGAIALLSIHPEFSEAILDGRKRVEFRRSMFRRPVTHIVMYSTEPVGRLTGVLEVDTIDQGSPLQLWRKYHTVSGLTRARFFDYYEGARGAVAIRIARAWPLHTPMELRQLGGRISPPQSFSYLSRQEYGVLVAAAFRG